MDLIYGTWSITTGYITCQHLFCYVIFPTQKLRNVSQKIVKRVQGTTLWFEKADWSRRIEKTTKTINQVINGRRIICHIYFPNMSIQKLNQSLKAFAQSREISVTIAVLIYTLVYEWCLNFRLKLSGWIKPKKYPGENTYSWGNLPPPLSSWTINEEDADTLSLLVRWASVVVVMMMEAQSPKRRPVTPLYD